jgi:hypothetical protein
VVVFQRPLRPGNRIDQSHRHARTAVGGGRSADRSLGSAWAIGHIEQIVSFFDRPAVVAALGDPVDFLDVVLANVSQG